MGGTNNREQPYTRGRGRSGREAASLDLRTLSTTIVRGWGLGLSQGYKNQSVLWKRRSVEYSLCFVGVRATFPPAHLFHSTQVLPHWDQATLRINAGNCTQKAHTKPDRVFFAFSGGTRRENKIHNLLSLDMALLETAQVYEKPCQREGCVFLGPEICFLRIVPGL